MDCATCHAPLPTDAQFCPTCGTKISTAVTGPTQRLHPSGELTCLRCGSEMEQGFTYEYERNGRQRSRWVAGEPERSIWHGGISTSDKRILRIRTYRCIACGYLESYARDDDDSRL
jgi:hypothetical protein